MDDSTAHSPSRTKGSDENFEREPPPEIIDRRAFWLPLAGLVTIVACSLLFYMSPMRTWIDASRLEQIVNAVRDEWWTPLAFAAAYVVFAIFLLPVVLLSTAAALIWGWKLGGVIELVAATLAAAIPFAIARGAAPRWLDARIARAGEGSHRLRDGGAALLLILRLVPIIPYVVLNYAAGVMKVRWREFLATTVLGMIPSIFIFAFFVEALAAGVLTERQVYLRIIAAGALLATLLAGIALITPHVRRRYFR